MRLLVFSDIHNNIAAVQSLRCREKNDYDAVVVAGDIGSDIAAEFFTLLDTFHCPVYCVYGNWDHELPYVRQHSKNCVLLHASVETHAGYFFTGFSGCPTHWGLNPIYVEELAITKMQHQTTLTALAELQAKISELAMPIEAEFKNRGVKLLARRAKAGPTKHRKARENLHDWREKQLRLIRQPEEKFFGSPGYRSYLQDKWECGRSALAKNRKELLAVIQRANIPTDRLIVVTHERLFRLADEGLIPLLHVFGHRHEYKFTRFAGTNYLNAAALDESLFISSEGIYSSPGGYCRVVLQHGQVHVERESLPLRQWQDALHSDR